MDDELFRLCRSVYKATGWYSSGSAWRDGNPIYSSDYLLEKLPLGENINMFVYRSSSGVWLFQWTGRNLSGIGDTPLKALLKLCLELHKEGLL